MGRLIRLASCLVTALAAGACHKEPPRTGDVVFEAPPAAPPLALSRFAVPLRYDFVQVLGIVEQAVPKKFGSMDSVRAVAGDDKRHYAFEATRGPFTAFASGKVIHLRSTLSYSARGYYKPPIGPTLSAGCGGDSLRPRITVELVTPLTLTPDWHLKSHARLARVSPPSDSARDHCVVSILRRDVTDRVVAAAHDGVRDKLTEIDRKVGGVDLKSHFEEWWGLLNKPISLTDGVWLLLGPEQLRLGGVSGHDHTLLVNAELDARPKIVTGTAPVVRQKPLPRLARDTVSNGFHILMEGVLDYGSASRSITAALRGKSIATAGRRFAATNVVVSPRAGGKVALSVDFQGDARGVLVFVGTPRYDARRAEIGVPDLDYDLLSDDRLINTYSWLRSKDLTADFRRRARISVSPLIDHARGLLVAGLNRKLGDAVTLSATVDSVSVKGLYVTRDGIVVRAEAAGGAGMSVKQR